MLEQYTNVIDLGDRYGRLKSEKITLAEMQRILKKSQSHIYF
jgi:hypothetical protein